VVLGGRLLAAPLSQLPGLAIAALLVGLCGVTADDCVQWMWGDGPLSRPPWTIALLASAVVGLPLSLLAEALLLRWTRTVPLGTVPQRSAAALRALLRTEFVEAAGNWLAGSLFWPAWLRLAGARVGRTCEISTVLDVLPEHLSIGDECFLADGIYLGPPRLQEGTATFAATRIGARTFVGNHAVVPGGAQLADDLLLGVATVADAANMPAGSAWFGLPAMRLPRREIVAMDRRLTHEPGPLRYGNRLFWETLRFLLPAWPLCLGLWWFDAVGRARSAEPAAWWLGTAALTTLLCVAALALTVLGTKWLLLGRVRPGRHALWSCWASRWDFHYVLWQRYGRALLAQLEQTLLLPWFLRAMGMRIGRGVVLGDGFAQVVDPDMLALGDGATVHALFQAHSFEDRVLKIDRVHVGAGATVGRGAVVLLGAVVGDRAHVAPHAVVMKQEHLLPDRAYEGAPVVEVAGAGSRQPPGG
jgi:non-ribosomal peptide synthetase-like protein